MSNAISEARVKLAEYERHFWTATAEFGLTPEDVLKPGYWAHMARKLTVRDRLEIWADDMSWFIECIVIEKGIGWVKLVELKGSRLMLSLPEQPETVLETPEGKYTVKWSGPHTKYRVTRINGPEKLVLKDGFGKKAEADKWLADHRVTIERSVA